MRRGSAIFDWFVQQNSCSGDETSKFNADAIPTSVTPKQTNKAQVFWRGAIVLELQKAPVNGYRLPATGYFLVSIPLKVSTPSKIGATGYLGTITPPKKNTWA
jgi:hypothetical protein